MPVRQRVVDCVRSLSERGYVVGLLTNNVAEYWPSLRKQLPIDELFDVVVHSGFVGMRKPEERIYRHTLELTGIGCGTNRVPR